MSPSSVFSARSSSNTSFAADRSADAFLMVREIDGQYRPARADEVLQQAQLLLAQRICAGEVMSSPQVVRSYLQVAIGALEHEVFDVLFLDAQTRVIAFKEMFRGSVTQTAVYPREIVKEALALNAAGVILAHNHPSGSTEPSRSDEYLTQALKAALSLVDVKVLDHLIVTTGGITSFAERGLL
jgi:DNA repair protein RadC